MFSDDITDGQVTTNDLAQSSVTPGRLHDNAVDSSKVDDGSLTGVDLKDGTITGEQIDEYSISSVPMASQGGIGAYAPTGSCDPESLTFVDCSSIALQMGRPGRVLIIAQVRAVQDEWREAYWGNCRLRVGEAVIHTSTTPVRNGDSPGHESMTLTAVSEPVAAGKRDVHVECNQLPDFSGIHYDFARLSAVALSNR